MGDVPAIARMLGGRRALKAEVASVTDLIDAIGRGLPYSSLEAVAKKVGLVTLAQTSAVLGIPERTLQRRAQSGRLDPVESELTVRLARVAQRTEDVFEDAPRAQRWLREANEALGGRSPLELIRTDLGTGLVEDVLTRIEHTVYG